MAGKWRSKLKGWLSTIRVQLFSFNQPPHIKAFSAGFGVFIGLTPFWGFQTLIAIGLSTVFKLNKVLTVAFSYVSLPPLIPWIIAFQWWLGGLFLKTSGPQELSKPALLQAPAQYLVGSGIMACVCGVIAMATVYGGLRLKRKIQRQADAVSNEQ